MINKRPLILISKCIEHGYCRYDSNQIASKFVKNLERYVDFIDVCPEIEIGLTIPREAIRILNIDGKEKLVYSNSGTEVTQKMQIFSKEFVHELNNKTIHGCIMKSYSPTCGFEKVKMYRGLGKQSLMNEKTRGFFGREVVKQLEGIPIEDEGRLRNYNIREQFLTSIFTLKDYDEVIEKNTIKSLIDFHSKNKYLLMVYNQNNQKLMGKIVANENKDPINILIQEYLVLLKKTLSTPLKRGSNINMIMHLFGYFKNDLSKEEKAYFLDVLEQYSLKEVPFSVPISIIYTWTLRFNQKYLKTQTIFKPYPVGILNVADSGKGID